MVISQRMRAARSHAVGEPLVLEMVDTPEPADGDVLVRVRSCGIVPNLLNVLTRYPICRCRRCRRYPVSIPPVKS